MVACALGGEARFRRECMIEREGATFVLRHRDGGFRRLELDEGDNRIRPADGFENALWREIGGGEIEVTMGRDRYRLALPAENRAATPQ